MASLHSGYKGKGLLICPTPVTHAKKALSIIVAQAYQGCFTLQHSTTKPQLVNLVDVAAL